MDSHLSYLTREEEERSSKRPLLKGVVMFPPLWDITGLLRTLTCLCKQNKTLNYNSFGNDDKGNRHLGVITNRYHHHYKTRGRQSEVTERELTKT